MLGGCSVERQGPADVEHTRAPQARPARRGHPGRRALSSPECVVDRPSRASRHPGARHPAAAAAAARRLHQHVQRWTAGIRRRRCRPASSARWRRPRARARCATSRSVTRTPIGDGVQQADRWPNQLVAHPATGPGHRARRQPVGTQHRHPAPHQDQLPQLMELRPQFVSVQVGVNDVIFDTPPDDLQRQHGADPGYRPGHWCRRTAWSWSRRPTSRSRPSGGVRYEGMPDPGPHPALQRAAARRRRGARHRGRGHLAHQRPGAARPVAGRVRRAASIGQAVRRLGRPGRRAGPAAVRTATGVARRVAAPSADDRRRRQLAVGWADRFGVTMTPTRCWPAQAGRVGEEGAR